MDWVKPKKERAKASDKKNNGHHPVRDVIKATESSVKKVDPIEEKNEAKVTTWLEELCSDSVTSLQQSPIPSPTKKTPKGKKKAHRDFSDSFEWGTSTLAYDIEEGPEVLQRLVEVWNAQESKSKQFANAPSAKNGVEKKGDEAFELASDDENSVATSSDASNGKDPHADEKLHRSNALEGVSRWIVKSLPIYSDDAYVALVCTSWTHGLRELGSSLPPALWLETLQSILTQVDRAWSTHSPQAFFPWLLWSCEIPLALATQLSQLGFKDRMVQETIDRVSRTLKATDEDPSAWLKHGGEQLRALLASVVRSHWCMEALGSKGLYSPERKSLAKLTEYAIRLCDGLGHPLLADPVLLSDDKDLWRSLATICRPNKKLDLLFQATGMSKAIFDGKRDGHKSSNRKLAKSDLVRLPTLGHYCEKAELATMRKSWDQPGVRMAIDYSQEPMTLDVIAADGQRILSGDWNVIIRRDGEVLETDVGWSDVCWFSDDDVDYLEVECALEGVFRIQRQMMLIRDESLIFLCDTLLANEPARWEVDSRWTIAADFEVRQNAKNHEAELHHRDASSKGMGDGRHALLLPLALPEWKRSPSVGKLHVEGSDLVLHQAKQGTRLMTPLVVAVRKVSKNQPYTWRPLTVAEDLQIQSGEIAQAFRVQVGKDQVVFYRSLAKTVRRSAMGLHLNSEFYAGRFDPSDGEFESIVEIDSDE